MLLTVNGWASWCAYLARQARLPGGSDAHLRDLLAIRLAWGAILLECRDDSAARRAFAALQVEWERAPALLQQAEAALLVDEVWQTAFEVGYQRGLAQRLRAVAPLPAADGAQAVEVQAAFCIDVRSEPLRRAIESVWPAVQTIGFAGFFGLPVAYTPLATEARRPQLPGLLAPALEVTEHVADTAADFGPQGDALQSRARQRRLRHFARAERWDASSRWPNAAFSSVEAVGAGYLGRLAQWLRPSPAARRSPDRAGLSPRYRPVCRPVLAGLDLNAKVDLAARVLHAMGLDRGLARLVLLVGHGSQSANNAQAAALDCGACCAQSGEVNARVLARLLNEKDVQAGLHARQRSGSTPDLACRLARSAALPRQRRRADPTGAGLGRQRGLADRAARAAAAPCSKAASSCTTTTRRTTPRQRAGVADDRPDAGDALDQRAVPRVHL